MWRDSLRPQPIAPKPGQESVWDYPRPPRVEDSTKHIRVICGGITIADTRRARRVLETSQAPVYYVPAADVQMQYLQAEGKRTFCEWKGLAAYYTVVVGAHVAREAAWSYPDPSPGYELIRDYIGFYPGRMDACYVDEEQARPMPGDFYAGWITDDILGPFKGAPGTEGW